MNNDFAFLTKEQVFGKNKLDIIKRYGTKCDISDFAVLLGGIVFKNLVRDGIFFEDRVGYWGMEPSSPSYNLHIVNNFGHEEICYLGSRTYGVRPALLYSSISSNKVGGVKEVEYGEYPQMLVTKSYSDELEQVYNSGKLKVTGKSYTTDSVDRWDDKSIFSPRKHIEYEYNGKKYIRFVGDANCIDQLLSNGEEGEIGKPYWLAVSPIVWLVDEEADIALSKRIIVSGVPFDDIKLYDGDFNKTVVKQFMNKYLSKEIMPDMVYSTSEISNQTQNFEKKEPIRKQNPYGFNFDDVSEEDIIKGAIESNVSVFLHGRSSEGKSARVKQLDPDCEIIYMRNATPDSLNGKSVYNSTTGEMIDVPPTWYSKIKEKCEAEPDKIHIIFFDELTNALPSIQGMAFNIVLDGEVNGKWKLPPNARIIAAGNDLNDSLAANQMAEPLFNRFAHVYINTTVDSWLKWASTPKEKYERLDYKEGETTSKIHPSVYAYIAYKSYSGQDVLRTPYTGDRPNADPRKWEMVSKVLFKTKQPEMLRALIGDELTRDFTAFAKQQVISVEDVINHNYSIRDLNMDISEKFATAVGLSSVDEEHFEIVRDFMQQVGAEPRAAFESMWAHGDEKRLEKIAELHLSQGGIRI